MAHKVVHMIRKNNKRISVCGIPVDDNYFFTTGEYSVTCENCKRQMSTFIDRRRGDDKAIKRLILGRYIRNQTDIDSYY